MTSRRRTLIPFLLVLVLFAGLAVAFYLRAQAPPEPARLLPESDAIVYLHLKTLRSLTHFDQNPVPRSADLQHFIDATGIQPERDLDAVAFALHRMPDAKGPNGAVAYSEVFLGRFDGERLAAFLHARASAEEPYAGRTIYTLQIDGRSLRVAQLAYDMVAASNMPTPEQIHSMLDRARASALSTPGSSLLAARYREVPKLPLPPVAWGIGHIGLPFSPRGPGNQPGHISLLGLELPLREDTDLVASLSYSGTKHLLTGGAAHLRIQEIATDADSAHRTVDALHTVLELLRAIVDANPPHNGPGAAADAAMRAVLQSVTLDQHETHALLNADATPDQLHALFTAHDPTSSPATSQ